MSFREDMVSDFKKSMTFLVDSMMQTFYFCTRGQMLASKPSWAVQVEKFSSLFDKIKDNQEMVDNLKYKVVASFFKDNTFSLTNPIIRQDGTVDDSFLKLDKNEDEEDGSYKIRTSPRGLYLQISKVFLPLTEVYTEAVKVCVANRGQNLPFPNQILLGIYSVVYFSVVGDVDNDQIQVIKQNITTLKESLEVCNEVKPTRNEGGPVDMIKNLLGNINFDQIGDMMSKVTGDEKSSKEFGEVFGKISDTIKSGGNPLDAMGDIIKQATMDAAESDPSASNETASNETASNETASNETASNETASNETASNETASNETASNETASNETASNETASNETASNETASNETASKETIPSASSQE